MTRLQYFRKKNNLTQLELSKISGLPVRSIQNLEQGVNNIDSLSLFSLVCLSEALHVSPSSLLEDDNFSRRVVIAFSAPTVQNAER